MKIPYFIKAIAITSLLPCIGVAVAAAVSNNEAKNADADSSVVQNEASAILPESRTELLKSSSVHMGEFYQAGVGAGEQRINHEVVRSHWATLDEAGNLQGTVGSIVDNNATRKPAAKMQVFLAVNGKVIQRVVSSDDGKFSFPDVEPGTYSLIARKANGFLAFGLNVFPHSENQLRNSNIDAAIVPTAFDSIKLENGVAQPVAVANFVAHKDKGRFDLTVRNTIASKEFETAVPASTLVSQTVSMTADGRMIGRIRKLDNSGNSLTVANADVVILDGKKEVGRTVTDRLGVFEIEDLEPKSYSLIASARQGFAAIGFELVEHTSAQLEAQGGAYTMLQGPSQAMDVAIADPVFIEEQVFETQNIEEEYEEEILGYVDGGFVDGGFVEGGGGLYGGGGQGLFGPIARIALIGGIAYGIYEIAKDDDNNSNPGATTPITP